MIVSHCTGRMHECTNASTHLVTSIRLLFDPCQLLPLRGWLRINMVAVVTVVQRPRGRIAKISQSMRAVGRTRFYNTGTWLLKRTIHRAHNSLESHGDTSLGRIIPTLYTILNWWDFGNGYCPWKTI